MRTREVESIAKHLAENYLLDMYEELSWIISDDSFSTDNITTLYKTVANILKSSNLLGGRADILKNIHRSAVPA